MLKKLVLKLLITLSLVYSLEGIDFIRFYAIRGVTQSSQGLPPLPTPKASRCLKSVSEGLIQCKNQSIKVWNIKDYSPIGDVCCAQWDTIECDIDHVTQAQCKSEEMDDVNDYFDDLIEFYNEKTCHPFPRGSTHCMIPILSDVTDERPPPPSPLAIDCLLNIRPEVRIACLKLAYQKWNITDKKPPIKNLCCAIWDDIDCLDEISKERCPANEVTSTEDYFKQIEQWSAKLSCKDAAYHSKTCSTSQKVKKKAPVTSASDTNDKHQVFNMAEFQDNYPSVVFPAKGEHKSQSNEYNPNYQIDSDYREFLMNYILTVFPHLMNLLILLTVILVTVIVIQCFLIGKQLKKNQYFRELGPLSQGYTKVDV